MEKTKKETLKFWKAFTPILKVLEKEKELSVVEIIRKVRDKYYSHLPIEIRLEKYEFSKVNKLNDHITWAITYLYNSKFIQRPKRAIYKITAKGLKTLKRGNLDWNTFKKDPDFKNWKKLKKKENNNPDENLEDIPLLESIGKELEKNVSKTKEELLSKLKSMDPYLFEKKILELFTRMGYGESSPTKKSRDFGIDGIIISDKLGFEKIYVQIKKWDNNQIQEKNIRDFIGAMSNDTNKGIFITTSNFSKNALKKAKDATHKIKIINGEKLVELMYKYNLGVEIKNTYDFKEIDESFFDEQR